MRGRTFSTPSGAARAVTGKPVDRWIFWRLPDGDRSIRCARTAGGRSK